MPAKAVGSQSKTGQITITMSDSALAMLQRLADIGFHGTSRSEITRGFIMDRLVQLVSERFL